MGAELYRVEGAYRALLAVAERPRGGPWLHSDLRGLREAGVQVLVSGLIGIEARELWLEEEAEAAESVGLEFVALPIPNMLVPPVQEALPVLSALAARVRTGTAVAAHCRAGVGRSPLIVASILALLGEPPEDAWHAVALGRGRGVPDTLAQRRWLAETLLPAHEAAGEAPSARQVLQTPQAPEASNSTGVMHP